MNVASVAGALVLATILTLGAAAAEGPVPPGWIISGSHPNSYEVGSAPQGGQNRGPAGFIRSKESVNGFGTLMQTVDAADYRGKRVRFSAVVRAENLQNWAGLWMRVDGPRGQDSKTPMLAFDNMGTRPIKGTTGWTRHEVVLDVAVTAEKVAFGILMNGTGAAWLDGVALEVVPESVPTTARKMEENPLPRTPKNLNFSG